VCLAAAVLTGCFGCAAARSERPGREPEPASAPSYEEIAAQYNQRVAPLDRVWARSVARVWYPDREGEEQTDQVEGHLMMIRPDCLKLTFKKLGETYAVLGSNPDQYWWIELGDRAGRRVAWVGEHQAADPERLEELGLPVHPLDLIEVIGVLPLPVPASGSPQPRVARTPEGVLVDVMPPPERSRGRVETFRYLLDPRTLEPLRIGLLDAAGKAILTADLSRYAPVIGTGSRGTTLATRMDASIDDGRRRMRLWINDADTSRREPTTESFVLDSDLKRYRVPEVQSIADAGRR
jgi:hypothetical protein